MSVWFALALTMVHTLWIGALVGLGALASKLVLSGADSRTRYVVALAWLILLAVVPAGVWYKIAPEQVPAPHVATPATAASLPQSSPPSLHTPVQTSTVESPADVPLPGPVEEVLVKWDSLALVLPWIWGLGSTAMLVWSLLGLAGAERLRKASEVVHGELATTLRRLEKQIGVRGVPLLTCAKVAGPVLVGVLKPVILVPPAVLSGLSARELEMLLLHELAHVRRWDNLVNLLQRLIESVLFFHPAVWGVSAWVRQERENCCDDLALATLQGEPHGEYASMLVRVHQLATGTPAVSLASGATGGNLVARVRRIVTRRESMRLSRGTLTTLILCAIVSGILVGRAVGADDPKVLTITKEGAQFPSIQAAIDAAPDGATVRVGPGLWLESIVIKKGITLEGAGWDKTTLIAAVPPEAQQAAKELSEQAQKGISPAEWKAKVDALAQKFPGPTVIKVDGAKNVLLRNLKVAGSAGPNRDGTIGMTTLVQFDRSTARVEDCVVAGSPGNGINVGAASDVKIQRTLVAGVWGTGIQIGSRDPGQIKAVVADSDIRNCYHRGITISANTDVTVERCRIWGSAWHGIRYDHASPTIRDNRIYNVARCGIYASGNTNATVTGNLFLNNEMDGISCWFNNQDRIENNTFANNQREGLSVLGASKPTVTNNVFVGQPAAIICSAIGGQDEKLIGQPALDGNWFWNNKANLQKPGEKELINAELPPDSKSHTDEVKFADPAKGNYTLAPGSATKAGAANPAGDSTPFILQPEEKEIMPDGDSWDYQKWKKG